MANDDLISRQAAIDAVKKAITRQWWEEAEQALNYLPSAERTGRWTIEVVHQYELAYGTTAYEPVYKCSCCGLVTESYLRLDEPIMPDDADFPKWCGNCGARMEW